MKFYKFIKWLYARYIDELYIPKRREVSVLIKTKGCCGNQNNNDVEISYSRAKEKDTAINKNSGEGYIFGVYNKITIWEKLYARNKK